LPFPCVNHRKVNKMLKDLEPKPRKRARKALKRISENVIVPRNKKLKGELKGYWSYKMGQYRIVYKKHSDLIDVLCMGHRKEVYEIAKRRLS